MLCNAIVGGGIRIRANHSNILNIYDTVHVLTRDLGNDIIKALLFDFLTPLHIFCNYCSVLLPFKSLLWWRSPWSWCR